MFMSSNIICWGEEGWVECGVGWGVGSGRNRRKAWLRRTKTVGDWRLSNPSFVRGRRETVVKYDSRMSSFLREVGCVLAVGTSLIFLEIPG